MCCSFSSVSRQKVRVEDILAKKTTGRRGDQGAEKLLSILAKQYPEEQWPAVPAGNLILKRNGLVVAGRRVRRIKPLHPIFDPHTPSDMWSADFKGKFCMGNGHYCHPLTVADLFSRCLFAAKGMHHPTCEGSKPVFDAIFREYGLPEQMRSPREYPNKITEWEYPKDMVVRCVSRNAAIRRKSSYWMMVSSCLAEKHGSWEELGNGIRRVFLRQKCLGYLDEKTLRVEDEQGRQRR